MIRTFVDTGGLMWFSRPHDLARHRAAASIIEDSGRAFVSSPFLEAELLPHARRRGRVAEIHALELYFDSCESQVDLQLILRTAEDILAQRPMGLVDALHLAAAYLL